MSSEASFFIALVFCRLVANSKWQKRMCVTVLSIVILFPQSHKKIHLFLVGSSSHFPHIIHNGLGLGHMIADPLQKRYTASTKSFFNPLCIKQIYYPSLQQCWRVVECHQSMRNV